MKNNDIHVYKTFFFTSEHAEAESYYKKRKNVLTIVFYCEVENITCGIGRIK